MVRELKIVNGFPVCKYRISNQAETVNIWLNEGLRSKGEGKMQ